MNLGLFQKEKIKSDDPRLIGQATSEQFARTHAALQTWSEAEHNDDGTHGAIHAESITVSPGGASVAGDLASAGDLVARQGTTRESGIGYLPNINGVPLLPGEIERSGLLLNGVGAGWFMEVRPLAQSPFGSGSELALWNLGFSTVRPIFRIGTILGVPTLIDGGSGATLNIGDFTEPINYLTTTILHAVNEIRMGTGSFQIALDFINTAFAVSTHWTPAGAGVSDLGIAARRWRNLNLSGGLFTFGRAVADGVWIDWPFNPADYTMNPGLVVAAADVPTNRYSYNGRTLRWQVNMQTFTVGGAGGTLVIRIPNFHTASHGFSNMGGLLVNPPGGFNWTPCIISWTAGAGTINVVPQSFSWTPGGADNNYCQFEVNIPINP